VERSGRNKGGYFGEQIDIHGILKEIDDLATAAGFSSEVILGSDALHGLTPSQPPVLPARFELKAYKRPASNPLGRVYISAGIHGDEPAGPLALARLFRRNAWPSVIDLSIVPCINPTGFQKGTRENYQQADLNRDYRQATSREVNAHIRWIEKQSNFDIAFALHEDWEANGFYVYELNPYNRPSFAQPMIDAVRSICPIETASLVDNWDCAGGVIRPAVKPEDRPQWAESIYLLKTKSRLNYTLESPSDFAMDIRVAALCTALETALTSFSKGQLLDSPNR
jgi:protein MpaA